MKISVEVGTVGDGTLKGAIQYCKDLELKRLGIGFRDVPGYAQKGYVVQSTLKDMMAEVQDAGLSSSVMVYWAPKPMIMGEPEGKVEFDNLCKSLEAMQAVGADVLSMFAMLEPPLDPKDEGARWALLVDFYTKLMAQAEQCGVKVALNTVAHPARNMLWNYAAAERLMQDVPSPSNGICFCVGNFWNSDGQRMYDIVHKLGDKLFYVHTRSTKASLGETPFWFDSGEPDIIRFIKTLREINYQGDVRSEHLPDVTGENRTDIGTAWSIGYLKAALQCTA